MPAVIPLIVAGVSAGASVYAAKKSAGAAQQAAAQQTETANHAADVQGASNDKALAFQREQAENEYRNQEAINRLTYGQYVAKANAARNLAQSFGWDLPEPAAYQGLPDPNYTNAAGAAGAAPGSASASDPVAFIRKFQSENKPTATPADLVKAAQGAGVTGITPYMYGSTPSNNEVSVNGQKFKIKSAEDSANPGWYMGGNDSGPAGSYGNSLASLFAPSSSTVSMAPIQPQTVALAPPVYQPRQNNLAAIFGVRA